MLQTKENDLSFGTSNEVPVLDKIQTFFGKKFIRQGGYSIMDYVDETKTIYVELKTRRITHNRYTTGMVGLNKIEFCKDPNVEYYFCFCYTDGLFYIKYNKDLFDTFERNLDYYRGERADCVNSAQSIVYIPINYLNKIN
jgi:hypothetical protein